MKLRPLLSTTFLLAVLLTERATADDLDLAVRAALDETPAGQPILFQPSYQLFKHKFEITPVQVVSKKKGQYSLAGSLSRETGTTRDQIAYRITRVKGAVTEITVQTNGGEWHPLAEPLLKVLGQYASGVVLPVDKQAEVNAALRQAVGDNWQEAAEFFIIQVALRHC